MNFPLFDSHCDTIYNITKKNMGLYINDGHMDLRKVLLIKPYAQFFAFFADAKAPWELRCRTIEECYRKMLFKLNSELNKHDDYIRLCRSADEAKKTMESGRAAAFISVEGAELLGCDVGRLDWAYGDGVRMVTITWNYENALSGSCADSPDKGLSPSGRSFVKRMHELSMLVDVSHLSDRGFFDVYSISQELKKPFIASHSNARAVCAHRRNLTDRQIDAILSVNGYIGLNLYSDFVKNGENAGFDDLFRHIEHFLSRGAKKNLGIGADLDGCKNLVGGIEDISGIGRLYDYLLKRNLPEETVKDIFYFNMMRTVERTCAM